MVAFVLALLAPTSGASALPAPDTCAGATCAWALTEAPTLIGWHAGAEEVAPAAHMEIVDAPVLRMEVVKASRTGSFYLSLDSPVAIPDSRTATFSVWLNSSGALDRFPILLREVGAPDAPEQGDTTFVVPPTREWTFVSFVWTAKRADSTAVNIALRGEVRSGASAVVEFAQPHFGADTTPWTVDGVEFAHGPRAGYRFTAPGHHMVRAGGQEFVVDGPSPPARLVDLDTFTSTSIPGGARFVASSVTSGFHSERLAPLDLASWPLATWELGPQATVAQDGGSLRLRIEGTHPESSAWVASEPIAWRAGAPLELVWRGHDDRGILRYELVALEPDGTRHVSAAPPGGTAGQSAFLRFTPASDRGEIQLRAIFAANASGTVWFDAASLRDVFTYAWALDGNPLGGDAPLVDASVDRTIPHTLGVSLTTPEGTVSRTEIALPIGLGLPGAAVVVRNDVGVGLVGHAATLDLSPTWEASANALATSVPWDLWRLEDGESPDLFDVKTGAVATIRALPAAQTRGGGIERLLAISPDRGAQDLTFLYRTSGGVDRVQALGRYHTPADLSYEEARANFTPSTDWQSGNLRIPEAGPNRTQILVGLRAIVLHDQEATVEFANITLTPALDYVWSGAAGKGPVARANSSSASRVPWTVHVTSPGGFVADASGVVSFLEPTLPYPTLHGGVAARWDASILPEAVRVEIQGPSSASAPGNVGSVATQVLTPGAYRVVATTVGGQQLVLGMRNVTDRATLAAVPVVNGSRGEAALLVFEPAAADLARVTAVLRDGLQHRDIALERRGPLWQGTWSTPLAWLAGDTRVTLRLEEATGAPVEVDAGVVHVAAGPHAEDASFLLAFLAAAVVLVFVPRTRETVGAAAVAVVVGIAASLVTAPVASALLGVGALALLAVTAWRARRTIVK